MVSECGVGLETLLLGGLSEPEFCGDFVCGFGEVVCGGDFPCRFRGMVVRCGGVAQLFIWL